MSTRQRAGGDIDGIRCDLRGGASGQTDGLLNRSGGNLRQGGFNFIDCIISGYANAFGENFNAQAGTDFENASGSVTYCALWNNAEDFDADLIAAVSTNADITTGNTSTAPRQKTFHWPTKCAERFLMSTHRTSMWFFSVTR